MSVTNLRRKEPDSISLGGAVDDVLALSIALALIEEPDQSTVTEDEIALARDRLTYMLYGRAQDLKKAAEEFV